MSNEQSTDQQTADSTTIKYPKQTSEWGRSLIDMLNVHLLNISLQIKCMNDNMNGKFIELREDIESIKTIANEAKLLAEKNKNDIDVLRSEVNCSRSEINFMKFTCDNLVHENAMLKL